MYRRLLARIRTRSFLALLSPPAQSVGAAFPQPLARHPATGPFRISRHSATRSTDDFSSGFLRPFESNQRPLRARHCLIRRAARPYRRQSPVQPRRRWELCWVQPTRLRRVIGALLAPVAWLALADRRPEPDSSARSLGPPDALFHTHRMFRQSCEHSFVSCLLKSSSRPHHGFANSGCLVSVGIFGSLAPSTENPVLLVAAKRARASLAWLFLKRLLALRPVREANIQVVPWGAKRKALEPAAPFHLLPQDPTGPLEVLQLSRSLRGTPNHSSLPHFSPLSFAFVGPRNTGAHCPLPRGKLVG